MLPPPPASHPHHSAGRPQSYHQMPTLIPWGGSLPATEPQRPPANRQPVWEIGDGARPVPTAATSVDPYVHSHTVAYPVIARTEKELQSEIHRLQGESAASTMQREVSQNELRSNIQTLEGNMLDLLREARSGSGSASVAGPTLPPHHHHHQQQHQQQPPPAVALAVAEGARSVAQHQHPPHTPHAQTASVAAAQHTFIAQPPPPPPPPPPAVAAAAHHHHPHAYPQPSTPAAPRHSTQHQQPGNPSVIALEKMRSHFSCTPCASANNDPYFAAQGAHTSFLASPRAAAAGQHGGDPSHAGTPPPAAGPGRTLGVHRSPRRSSRWQLADTFAINPAAFGQLSPTAAQQQPAHAYPQQSMWQQPQQQPLHPYDASLSTLVGLPASHPSVHRPHQQQPLPQAAAPTSPLPSLRAAVAALRGDRSGGGSPTPTQHQLPSSGGGLFSAAAAATPKRGGDVSTLVTSPLLSGGLGGAGGPFHLDDDAAFVNPILAGRGVSGGISESQPRHAGGSPAPDMGTSPRLLPNHGPPSAVGTSMHPPSMSTGLALISGMTEGRLGVASGSPQPSPAAVPQYPSMDASRRL